MHKFEKIIIGLALGAAVSLGMPFMAYAGTTTVQKAVYTDIDKTLAPIALYPDSLLGSVLIASTYPDQIIEANNWYKSNSDVPIDKISDLVKYKNWNESVVSLLVVTPDVINYMAENMDWTNDLAYIFSNKNDEMYTSIQKLRNNAYNTGTLTSTKDVKVVKEKEYIYITPASADTIVVPTYDPVVVYDYPGSSRYAYTNTSDAAIIWGSLALVTAAIFCTSSWDWYNHDMWWGPGYGYYRYYDHRWYPWYDHPRHYPPPPPPPRPEPYRPKPMPHPPHHDHHHDHHHDPHHYPHHCHNNNPGGNHHDSSPIPSEQLGGGYIHNGPRRSVNNGVVGGSSMNKTKTAAASAKRPDGRPQSARPNPGYQPNRINSGSQPSHIGTSAQPARPAHHGSKIYSSTPNLPAAPKSQNSPSSSRVQTNTANRPQYTPSRPSSTVGSSARPAAVSRPASASRPAAVSKPASASHPTFDPARLKSSAPTQSSGSRIAPPGYKPSGSSSSAPARSYNPSKSYSPSGSVNSGRSGSSPSRPSYVSSPVTVQNSPTKTYNPSPAPSRSKTNIFGTPSYTSSPRSSSYTVRTQSTPSYTSSPRSSGSTVSRPSSSYSSTPRTSTHSVSRPSSSYSSTPRTSTHSVSRPSHSSSHSSTHVGGGRRGHR